MKQWSLFITLVNMMPIVKLQFAVQMYAVPPAAMPVMLPALAVQMPHSTTTSTTTTTTPRSVAIAVAVPVQMPVQFALPAYAPPSFCQAKPRQPNCPPCPPCLCVPSCTPAFFAYCSPCHQKCRCVNADSAPSPMPPNPPIALPGPAYPMPVPPPLVVVPFPPSIRFPQESKHRRKPNPFFSSDTSSDTSDDSSDVCSDDSCTSGDTDYLFKRAKKRKKAHRRRKRISGRRNIARSSDSEVVKPVLTYVSQNGNVKFKTKISNAEAAELLGEKRVNKQNRQVEKVQVVANEDSENRPQVVVVSHDTGDSQEEMGRKKLFLRSGSSKQTLQKGKKEIVFRPPSNKKISNLSVSFQVTE